MVNTYEKGLYKAYGPNGLLLVDFETDALQILHISFI